MFNYGNLHINPTTGAATRPLYMRAPQKGTNLIYFHDANKNVSELHFLHIPNGIAAHYEYDAFGNVTKSTRNTTVTGTDYRTFNPFQFSSEYFDSELDLVYYNYRHYNPSSGRFLSRDPIQEHGGFNLYGMCRNRIISKFDYLGLFFTHNCDKIGDREILYVDIAITSMGSKKPYRIKAADYGKMIDDFLGIRGFTKTALQHGFSYAVETLLTDEAKAKIREELNIPDITAFETYGDLLDKYFSAHEFIDIKWGGYKPWTIVYYKECECNFLNRRRWSWKKENSVEYPSGDPDILQDARHAYKYAFEKIEGHKQAILDKTEKEYQEKWR